MMQMNNMEIEQDNTIFTQHEDADQTGEFPVEMEDEGVQRRVVEREVREDVANVGSYDKCLRVDSELLFEERQTTEAMLRQEAKEVFVSRKNRAEKLE